MSMPITKIVQVDITRATRTVTQAGFGVPLIFGTNAAFAIHTVRSYSSLLEVAVDFAAGDDEYKAANALFAQSPSPETIKITKRAVEVAHVQTIVLDIDFVVGNVATVDVDGTAVAETYAVSHIATLAAWAAKIQLETGVATAVSDGVSTITVTAQTAGIEVILDNEGVTGGVTQPTLTIADTTPNVGIASDIPAVSLVDDDWYACLITSRVAGVVMEAARAISAVPKIFLTASSAVAIYDPASTTDIAYLMDALNYRRSGVMFNETNDHWADGAWFGRCLPKDPGSITWKFWDLIGVVDSNLTSTQRDAILNKNANLVTEIGGQDMTEEGTMASGEYIDEVRGIDWITARMQENVYGELLNADKVPYTDAGIAIIEGLVRKTLWSGIGAGFLAADPDSFDGEAFSITVPKASAVSAADKGNRILNNVEWQCTLAGAIHKVVISGRVEL